jgi:hypothetical protein
MAFAAIACLARGGRQRRPVGRIRPVGGCARGCGREHNVSLAAPPATAGAAYARPPNVLRFAQCAFHTHGRASASRLLRGEPRWRGRVVAQSSRSGWLVRGHSWVEWPPRAGLPARRRASRHCAQVTAAHRAKNQKISSLPVSDDARPGRAHVHAPARPESPAARRGSCNRSAPAGPRAGDCRRRQRGRRRCRSL